MFSAFFSVLYSTGVHFGHKNYFFCPKAKVSFLKYRTNQFYLLVQITLKSYGQICVYVGFGCCPAVKCTAWGIKRVSLPCFTCILCDIVHTALYRTLYDIAQYAVKQIFTVFWGLHFLEDNTLGPLGKLLVNLLGSMRSRWKGLSKANIFRWS